MFIPPPELGPRERDDSNGEPFPRLVGVPGRVLPPSLTASATTLTGLPHLSFNTSTLSLASGGNGHRASQSSMLTPGRGGTAAEVAAVDSGGREARRLVGLVKGLEEGEKTGEESGE